jgi:hypothetical protein
VPDLYSNGPSKDLVIKPFEALLAECTHAHLAAPYFTQADEIVKAAKTGKSIDLLIGLNSATSPDAVAKVLGIPGLSVRFLTRRFHAKIFIFDDAALVGSSNLTEGGLFANREATIRLNAETDADRLEEVRAIFFDLWGAAEALTTPISSKFRSARSTAPSIPDLDALVEKAVGRVEPPTINASGQLKSARRIYEMELRRQLNEQYRPAFAEVQRILSENEHLRADLANLSPSNQTNRFLNWLRLTFVHGDDAWQQAPMRSEAERSVQLAHYGAEWVASNDNRVPDSYVAWLETVESVFGTKETLLTAGRDEIMAGLMSLHAFTEQLRFTKGGLAQVPQAFWSANSDDVDRVRRSLSHLIHGPGDFVLRLHDLLYDAGYKLGMFGRFSALELYGTIQPAACPPMNGRMAKALRFLGHDVRAT